MKSVDYIIIGCGLASIAFCEYLQQHQKTFIVYNDSSQKSSLVAAGTYNPVILKRFTPVWKAKAQLKLALPLYQNIEQRLNITIDYKLPILRRFTAIQEQNLWFEAQDKPALKDFMSTNILQNKNTYINAAFGFGEVLKAGRLDTKTLIKNYKKDLKTNNQLIEHRFIYDKLQIHTEGYYYENYKSKHIIFSEGFGVKKNPFFKNVPIQGTKGELLTIKAPKLNINYAIKSAVFIIPIGNDLYTVGSTYNWSDKTNTPTETAKEELVKKLKNVISCTFEIINHSAGIRPTVKDRRPIVGEHQQYKNMYILNGLGSRGVMIAPYAAKQLFEFIEYQTPLDEEMHLNRFN